MFKRLALPLGGLSLAALLVFASLSFASGPDPAPQQQVQQVSCTTGSGGVCTVDHNLGVVPEGILLTPSIASGAGSYTLTVVRNTATASKVTVRAADRNSSIVGRTIFFTMVVFRPGAAPPPPSTTTPPPTSTTSPTTTTPPPTSTTPPPTPVLDLPRVPWEGGSTYWDGWTTTGSWSNPAHFPLGVWFESILSQGDVDLDKAAGLNTYVELTDNTNMSLVRSNGMSAIPGGPKTGYGSETAAWLLADEADMFYGPGAGYTHMDQQKASMPNDGRPHYANFGKGVIFWETDAEAERFINDWTKFTSADIYWYTDPNTPSEGQNFLGIPSGESRRAANYGATMDRMRFLDGIDGVRQPVWNFVEVGHPAGEDFAPTITGPQIQGAVMSSLIHEARGIIYFNHNFGGSCISQHVLRDGCGAQVRPFVTDINAKIKSLAPVLNTQSYVHTFNPALDTMLKVHNGSAYVFSMLKRTTAPGSHQFTLPAGITGTSVEVVGENRSVPVVGGKFTDNFAAEYSHHVYKIVL